MPIKPIDHTKSVVYRLVYNHITYYVGSTTNFTVRKNKHKSDCYNENNQEKYNKPLYKFIRENGGFTDKWKMILVQEYPECKSNIELRMYEQVHLDLYRPDLNVNRAFVTEEDKKNEKIEYCREYRIEKKVIINGKQNVKHKCECGGKFTFSNKCNHINTQKHKEYLQSLPTIVQQP